MKKTMLILLLGAFGSTISYAQGGLILKGGVNLANVSVTSNGRVDDAKTLTSFHVGLVGDVALTNFLSLQPGVLLTGKGSKTQSGAEGDANFYKATTNPLYIEIPANLVVKLPMTSQTKFFFGAGPYLAIGIAGKNKTEGRFIGTEFKNENDIKFSNDDPTTLDYEEGAGFGILRRFDYGLNGTAGFEFQKVLLSANYGLGLAKLQSGTNSSSDDMNKHRVLSFSLGIKL